MASRVKDNTNWKKRRVIVLENLGIKMLDCPIARLYTGKYVLTLSGTAFCLVSGAAVTRRIGIQLNLTGLLKPKQGRVFEVNPGVSGKIRQL